MKKQLLKMFCACLPVGMAFIVSAMMFSVCANAQIVYTDVIPDSTLYCVGSPNCTKDYNLDLNNDANNDFIITTVHNNPNPWWASTAYASPLNGNAVKDTLGSYYSLPIQFNAVIDSNLLLNQTWQNSGQSTMNYCDLSIPCPGGGFWNNLSDYYLGLRLLQSGQNYYGWARLRVDVTGGHASVIIRDYAYNSIPNQPILAGQTTATGIIENSFASSINLFPNPATNHLTIALGSNNQKVEVRPGESVLWRITITDITGKIIYSTTASETQKIEVNTQYFAEGIYVVQIQSADFKETRKLIIAK